VRGLDGALLHAVDHAEGGHQFAGRVDRDLELAADIALTWSAKHLAAPKIVSSDFGKLDASASGWRMGSARPRRLPAAEHARDACILDE
jgi:hypothetical protein